MTIDEFEENYCKLSEIEIPFYQANFVTLPCKCGDRYCNGWAAVANNSVSIKAHAELYEG